MSQSPIISISANLQRIKACYQEEILKKTCESVKFYIEKATSLQPPYSQDDLLVLANLIASLENLLNIQKSSIVSSLVLVQSTKNLLEHSLKVQSIFKPKVAKEKKAKAKNLPVPNDHMIPTRGDIVQYALDENGICPSSFY